MEKKPLPSGVQPVHLLMDNENSSTQFGSLGHAKARYLWRLMRAGHAIQDTPTISCFK